MVVPWCYFGVRYSPGFAHFGTHYCSDSIDVLVGLGFGIVGCSMEYIVAVAVVDFVGGIGFGEYLLGALGTVLLRVPDLSI